MNRRSKLSVVGFRWNTRKKEYLSYLKKINGNRQKLDHLHSVFVENKKKIPTLKSI